MAIKATPDYLSAASRHLRDANFLFENKHHDNAAYIAGYVAECALKTIIEIAGRPPKVHNLAILSGDALNLAADLSFAVRRYQVDLSSYSLALQTNWNINLRYCASGFINENEAKIFIENANQFYHATIGAMVLDGLLERLPQ